MSVERQIDEYIGTQSEAKQAEMRMLHQLILDTLPATPPKNRLWFNDGKNEEGKVLTNPNIGYGQYTIHYKGGDTKDFYRIGLSGNTTGISVYILGLEDKKFLANTYGKSLGKASVTGYCIKFRSVKDINLDVLRDAIQHAATL
jgi:hypothetical protein